MSKLLHLLTSSGSTTLPPLSQNKSSNVLNKSKEEGWYTLGLRDHKGVLNDGKGHCLTITIGGKDKEGSNRTSIDNASIDNVSPTVTPPTSAYNVAAIGVTFQGGFVGRSGLVEVNEGGGGGWREVEIDEVEGEVEDLEGWNKGVGREEVRRKDVEAGDRKSQELEQKKKYRLLSPL